MKSLQPKYLNRTLLANKEVTYKGQKWYQLISGKETFGWIAAHQVKVFPENNFKNVRKQR
ncbi:GW dipeptide domain-containing protein [Metabacillus idriensis]|uniref:GW dipeptide domain-containing protein n=1 Tax=Metabacillus idriensis TaxID=324768 RepID=UPI001CD1A6EB